MAETPNSLYKKIADDPEVSEQVSMFSCGCIYGCWPELVEVIVKKYEEEKHQEREKIRLTQHGNAPSK